MKSIAFFNNKGGVGKTTLVYHVAYMMAEKGYNVIVADLDPQANLSSMFLSEAGLYEKINQGLSIMEALKPLVKGTGDIQDAHVEPISHNLHLIIGNLDLASFEDELSKSWGESMDGKEPAFRKMSSFYRILKNAALSVSADYILLDVGPNLGAINRAALIAVDFVIVPVGADLFSVQGITNVGQTLKDWRMGWHRRLTVNPEPQLALPEGKIQPIGYIVSQHGVKESRAVSAYLNWAEKIPAIYRAAILDQAPAANILLDNDPHCLAQLKHYRSLAPMAMESNKPMFFLKPADGAIGAHLQAVRKAYSDFEELTLKILENTSSV